MSLAVGSLIESHCQVPASIPLTGRRDLVRQSSRRLPTFLEDLAANYYNIKEQNDKSCWRDRFVEFLYFVIMFYFPHSRRLVGNKRETKLQYTCERKSRDDYNSLSLSLSVDTHHKRACDWRAQIKKEKIKRRGAAPSGALMKIGLVVHHYLKPSSSNGNMRNEGGNGRNKKKEKSLLVFLRREREDEKEVPAVRLPMSAWVSRGESGVSLIALPSHAAQQRRA